MDYFTRTYVSGQPYSSQKSFMRARPQTNVKLITTNRSQVNYSSTPQATLRKPYQHDTYDEMPYLFSGYPAVRRNWFDSKVGGQGSKTDGYATKSTMPFAHRATNSADDTWANVRDAVSGSSLQPISIDGEILCAVNTISGYQCGRIFLSFDLTNIPFNEIKSCYFGFSAYPNTFDSSRIVIQESYYNPRVYPTDLTNYSKFKGAPLAIQTYTLNWNLVPFNRGGVRYIKSKIGRVASLCIREYKYDYKNVQPVGAITNSMYLSTIRLFINHKGNTIIISPDPSSSGGDDGGKLIPA